MKVPFFNYPARYAEDHETIKNIVYQIGTSDDFILKENVLELEEKIRNYTGAKHAIATSNGTSALTIILRAMGVGPGVDVLTPAFSFISTASTIVLLGGRPIFVDVDPLTGMMDPCDLEAKITPQSKVIIPTHLFSVMADMSAIYNIAKKNHLLVLEDSAVSLGARMNGKMAGMLGDVGLYSFFPAKPLGGIGDGAIIVTNNDELGKMCWMLRNHGQDGINRFVHHHLGYNHRMDETVAAYLVHKLSRYDQLLARRSKIGSDYNEAFKDLYPQIQVVNETAYDRVYYTYVLQVENRDNFRQFLHEKGIETQIYYPLALPLQPAFSFLKHQEGDFPVAEGIAKRSIAIPLYAEMPDEHIEYVVQSVLQFVSVVNAHV
ncbi:DegT/DnrJ/EryC1/StrS family aminotransferase [Bacillus changyiensis]|uniref:DegT/DnrJ/EryC1/StrS family aminotransferase n=1 Tax=Bacillus changyiensis TaxID=3004103 RepID=UPI0022E1DB30|nr:DegT/DnrJ/EryC1/StrS family aminotransferase [Bacillus changyiensis]MDA1478067.1 DegT/DnrJ/EryC1/StrS family aminotransferase [Bacillus changyiensis]